jgi:hypothetical protein
MFFGIAIAAMLFLFVARIAIVAFVIAAALSIVYAVFRRVKDFISYDRYGEPYHKRPRHPRMDNYRNHGMESFYNDLQRRGGQHQTIQVVEVR